MNSREEINLDEISIYGILRNLALNFWLVLLAAAGAWFLVTGVKEMSWTPKYTSSAVMAVNSRGSGNDAYSSLSLTSQMAGIFSEVFSSNVLKDRIAQSLGQEEVEAEISAAVVTETNLITLSVTAGDPRQAYMVLQAAIDNYDTVSDYLFSNAVLRMVQEPDIPFAPSNPLRIDRIRTLAAAGAGAAVCACIALLSVMRFTVQTRTGARRNLDGRILETLPFEKKYKTLRERFSRRKKGILITSPLVGMGFAESVEKLAAQLEHHMTRRGQKVLLVSSVAENEGKSSVAANLALALAERGRRVILMDADMKKPAIWRLFDCRDEGAELLDYLEGKAKLEEILQEREDLTVVLQRDSVKNSSRHMDSPAFKELLGKLRTDWDYVILDSAPMAFTSDAEFLLKEADAAVLVVRQDWSDVRAVNEAADAIRQSGADLVGFVLNAFRGGRSAFRHGYGYYGYGKYRQKQGEEV